MFVYIVWLELRYIFRQLGSLPLNLLNALHLGTKVWLQTEQWGGFTQTVQIAVVFTKHEKGCTIEVSYRHFLCQWESATNAQLAFHFNWFISATKQYLLNTLHTCIKGTGSLHLRDKVQVVLKTLSGAFSMCPYLFQKALQTWEALHCRPFRRGGQQLTWRAGKKLWEKQNRTKTVHISDAHKTSCKITRSIIEL